MDILLTHGYFIDEDPQEREVMKPYPPLGILYLSSHLRARGFTVDVFDTTFASFASFRTLLKLKSPSLVGIYGNLTTRGNTLRLIRLCKEQ